MSNQLSIPFKKTYLVPIHQAVRDYVQNQLTDVHPDAFKWDIKKWEMLRKRTLDDTVHHDRINDLLNYQTQLMFILTKLPPNIGLDIPYSPAFSPSSLPITLCNLVYERCGVLFNLAALYSKLASTEDRSNSEGLKRASKNYQSAAGTLSYLGSTVLPKLKASLLDEETPLEFTDPFVKSLEWLMLAQAQECAWQLATSKNSSSSSIIARLSAQVSTYYRSAAVTACDASPSIKHLFPANWIAHVQAKQYHFDAAAQYRKSIDDLEANRYGEELARLIQAQKTAKEAYDTARRGSIMPMVVQDINSLLEAVKGDFTRAERDNNLIYHKDVPSFAALPAISPASMVKPDVPNGLQDPQSIVQSDGVIFGELLAYGAKTAIDIYNYRKNDLISEEIGNRAKDLDAKADATLRALYLPASLEALTKSIGLPPSLLGKAQEIKDGNIPSTIDGSIEIIQGLAKRNVDILDEAIQILDDEAEEDESFRQNHQINRPQSFEANKDLTDKHARYRKLLDQAAESDRQVRDKWEEWQDNILQLTWDQDELEASVPSSTLVSGHQSISINPHTTMCAQALRALLESLDDLRGARAQLVQRAHYAAEADDIQVRIMKQAAGIERWTEVQPSMFEDTLEQELAKYDKYKSDLEDGEREQEKLLEEIEARNATFLESRRDDQSVKEREHAIQSLELAYHKCKEIERNLEEGRKFHGDFAIILYRFRDECKQWAYHRQYELQQSVASMSITARPSNNTLSPPIPKSEPPERRPQGGSSFMLPPPDSEEWESVTLPPAPQTAPKVKYQEKQ